MEELVYIYAIAELFKYNPLASRQLIDSLENPSSLFSMTSEELETGLGIKGASRSKINDSLLEKSRKELEWAKSKGVSILSIKGNDYPPLLKECADAPIVLFYIGTSNLSEGIPVSLGINLWQGGYCKGGFRPCGVSGYSTVGRSENSERTGLWGGYCCAQGCH